MGMPVTEKIAWIYGCGVLDAYGLGAPHAAVGNAMCIPNVGMVLLATLASVALNLDLSVKQFCDRPPSHMQWARYLHKHPSSPWKTGVLCIPAQNILNLVPSMWNPELLYVVDRFPCSAAGNYTVLVCNDAGPGEMFHHSKQNDRFICKHQLLLPLHQRARRTSSCSVCLWLILFPILYA